MRLSRRYHAGQRPFRRRVIWTFAVLGIVALTATAEAWLADIGHWLTYPAQAQPADAIVVYGGAQERKIYGIGLYQRGFAPELWQTGNAGDYSSLSALLRKQHLLLESIQYIPSNSTWKDGQGVAALAQQRHLRRILVVTSWYHGRRAMCVIRKQLAGSSVEVFYDAPPNDVGGPNDWWKYPSSRQHVIDELVKLPYYLFRYGVMFWDC
jgi:uncharacterized SAM-binding protein YcdF (DUF218 family)